ncbi:MAG: LytTR family DNA-binding domain-containing protein [Bacteroidota bacterium]
MIQAVIVEDEGVAARRLKRLLEQAGLQVLASLKSNVALQAYIQNHPAPDLYFMDIHLSDGVVFETLQTVKLSTPIIFTTAYNEFAIKAFKQNSVDYLLKPIGKKELHQAIEKFKQLFQTNTPTIDLQVINQLLKSQTPSYRDRIKVKVGNRLRIFQMKDVALIYSESKITFIHVADGRSYPIDQILEQLYQELEPSQFYRVNRGQIVNINFITDIISYSNSRLKVIIPSIQQEIIIARERVKDFKAWLG